MEYQFYLYVTFMGQCGNNRDVTQHAYGIPPGVRINEKYLNDKNFLQSIDYSQSPHSELTPIGKVQLTYRNVMKGDILRKLPKVVCVGNIFSQEIIEILNPAVESDSRGSTELGPGSRK